MVTVADVQKDLPDWPAGVIEPWLIEFANDPDMGWPPPDPYGDHRWGRLLGQRPLSWWKKVNASKKIPFQSYVVPNGAALVAALAEIEQAAREGCRPLIYLDMHGSPSAGVEIAASGEMVPWDDVVGALRKINRETGNNLLVVAAVCYGLHAIKESTITDLTPFFVLIAPEETITFGDLMDRIHPFFRNLLTNLDAVKAFDEELSPRMKMFHCVRAFTVGMGKYIARACMGKGGRERRERLLTELIESGYPKTPEGLRAARKAIQDGTKPSQQMLDRYAGTFLGGKPLGYDLETLLKLVEGAVKA